MFQIAKSFSAPSSSTLSPVISLHDTEVEEFVQSLSLSPFTSWGGAERPFKSFDGLSLHSSLLSIRGRCCESQKRYFLDHQTAQMQHVLIYDADEKRLSKIRKDVIQKEIENQLLRIGETMSSVADPLK